MASAPRPTQLAADSEEIRERARQVQDTEDTWRVYRREWVSVFVSEELGPSGASEVVDRYKAKFEGRVLPEHWRASSPYADGPTHLQLALWNLVAEWKHRELADQFASGLAGETAGYDEVYGPPEVKVVSRHSREEVELKEYSQKKLTSVTARMQGARQ